MGDCKGDILGTASGNPEVPVLDGTLAEYRTFVISPEDVAVEEQLSTEQVDANVTDTDTAETPAAQ